MTCEYCGDPLPDDYWTHETIDEYHVFCSSDCIDKWLAAPTLEDELRELIERWRDYGGRVQGEEYYNGTLNGLHKAADELERVIESATGGQTEDS